MSRTDSTGVSIEELLTHTAWLQRLARSLVGGDESCAEDLVQDTWLRALRRPPRTREKLRGWLGRVIGNLARERARPRRALEHPGACDDAGGPEPQDRAAPTPEQCLARIDMQRVLAEELAALESELRTTLVLYYHEGCSTERISELCGVPVGTTRWRLARGRELLRERLDRRAGGVRSQWVEALAPWLVPGTELGGFAVSSASALSALVVALVAGVALVFALPRSAQRMQPRQPAVALAGGVQHERGERGAATLPEPVSSNGEAGGATGIATGIATRRAAAGRAARGESSRAGALPTSAVVHLRAVDEAGRPPRGHHGHRRQALALEDRCFRVRAGGAREPGAGR